MKYKESSLAQMLGRWNRATGGIGGPMAPPYWQGIGGPVTGALTKGLLAGVPAYALTRLLLPMVNKDLDPHRTALASALGAGLFSAAPNIGEIGYNLSNAPGGIWNKVKSMNKNPGTWPVQPVDRPWYTTPEYDPEADYPGPAVDLQMVKQQDFTGGADYNGTKRTGMRKSKKRGTTTLGELINVNRAMAGLKSAEDTSTGAPQADKNTTQNVSGWSPANPTASGISKPNVSQPVHFPLPTSPVMASTGSMQAGAQPVGKAPQIMSDTSAQTSTSGIKLAAVLEQRWKDPQVQDLLRKVREAQIRYIIGSGYGMRHWRDPNDVDVSVHPEDWEKLKTTVVNGQPGVPPSGEGELYNVPGKLPVDFHSRSWPMPWEQLGKPVKDEYGNPVMNLRDILKAKQTMNRPEDQPDIQLIKKMLHLDEYAQPVVQPPLPDIGVLPAVNEQPTQPQTVDNSGGVKLAAATGLVVKSTPSYNLLVVKSADWHKLAELAGFGSLRGGKMKIKKNRGATTLGGIPKNMMKLSQAGYTKIVKHVPDPVTQMYDSSPNAPVTRPLEMLDATRPVNVSDLSRHMRISPKEQTDTLNIAGSEIEVNGGPSVSYNIFGRPKLYAAGSTLPRAAAAHELTHYYDRLANNDTREGLATAELPAILSEIAAVGTEKPEYLKELAGRILPKHQKLLGNTYDMALRYGPQFADNPYAKENIRQAFGYQRGEPVPKPLPPTTGGDVSAVKNFITSLRNPRAAISRGYGQWLKSNMQTQRTGATKVPGEVPLFQPVSLEKSNNAMFGIKTAQNMGTAATEGNSFETKPTYEESVSTNDITERARRKAKGKRQGADVAFASSDVQPCIRPSSVVPANKIVKDGAVALMAAGSRWAEKHNSVIKSSDYYMASGVGGDWNTFNPPGADVRIPVHYTEQQIDNDPYLAPTEKARLLTILDDASGGKPGLISVSNVIKAGIGAGLGYAGASLFGKVIGGIFGGLSTQTQKRMSQAGAVAGMLANTGVLR